VRDVHDGKMRLTVKERVGIVVVGGTLILIAVAVVVLMSLGESSPPMGSGETCHRNLGAKVTTGYLSGKGLSVQTPEDAAIVMGGAIAEICREGPPDTSIDEGAERVVTWLKANAT
jgi:hypothetical protein